MPRKAKKPVFDDDNPEWTKADFAKATRFEPSVKMTDLTPQMLARIKNARGPKKPRTKIASKAG
jgi:hypothetical protein